MKTIKQWIVVICLSVLLLTATGCTEPSNTPVSENSTSPTSVTATTTAFTEATSPTDVTTPPDSVDLDSLPAYSDSAFAIINDNVPLFTEEELTTDSFETYSALDALGRCGAATACVGKDIMPTEDRDSIISVTPSGWHNEEYDFVDGRYVYNRCHLLGFQLTGENDNERNLITGTRYMHVEGMLPFENMVADYVKETDNHVMLRVTPYYDGDNLVASGVVMEAYSVEDHGEGICFHVYCYNVQPGVVIDYATGHNVAAEDESDTDDDSPTHPEETTYVLNTNTKKIHKPTCRHVQSIKDDNYAESTDAIDDLESRGYECCKTCF